MSTITPTLSKAADGTRQLKQLLEDWPLYRPLRLKYGPRDSQLLLPNEIERFCIVCKSRQRWALVSPGYAALGTSLNVIIYTCKNCRGERTNPVSFWILHLANNDEMRLIQKCGQHPAPAADVPLNLKLDGVDSDLYSKAIRSRDFSYGLAAVAYLRRVVENRMNALLDLLGDVAKDAGRDTKDLQAVKSSRTFDAKVMFAAGLIPAELRPGGINPIDRLHDLASDGLHNKSEEECLEIFDACRAAFEFVFRRLEVSKAEAKAFLDAMKRMNRPT